ncbi:MAG: delta-lactam-biosynthetic de-N-acetylase [Ruminococcaceae bacterium]|nr:delta-lactam-biosynthetic de-N-acetylase [Oscillospiraceae bacterium]
MKKIIAVLSCVAVLYVTLTLTCFAAPTREMHWYCARRQGGKQALAPQELAVVESHGGVYIDHHHDDDNPEKVVYLTFDAGYENGNIEKILDTLKETNTPAAFFVLEHLAKENPALLQRMKQEGHLICNHTASHKNLSKATQAEIEEEIKRLESAVESAIGEGTSPYFRPPEGSFSIEMLESIAALGYKTVFWSFAYADWDNSKQPDRAFAQKKILDNVHNGAVILLHPTSATNAAILLPVITSLKEDGYRFGTLDELCRAR